ncbi:hypothetical protein NECAME_08538 [Necator americanus]|uniref:VWFA domain-containing protein n=1 Tax=Necator americanus TaxID=51031 RepID=W2TJL8_NECAM|nr:hypothetical protein NECAME_08538 [Necator americanus]ETN81361.1 hypothetical protein NECAME_08538 [Necator americanus]
MSGFTVSRDSARVGILAVGADDCMLVAQLDAIRSQNTLAEYLKTLPQYESFDDEGQDIAGFNEEPEPVAQQMLKGGTYGIITVGYGPQAADRNALQSISGGERCTFTADTGALNNIVPSIQTLIKEAE